ncbi:hypothetical protein EDB83DRAFT_2310583 [Lactarius deliciosus]|nr:hypothetical protein EDB83DRAFT_2310583 [Lactarius deliciosus]
MGPTNNFSYADKELGRTCRRGLEEKQQGRLRFHMLSLFTFGPADRRRRPPTDCASVPSRMLAASTAEEYENSLGRRYTRQMAVFTWPGQRSDSSFYSCMRLQDPKLLLPITEQQTRIDLIHARHHYEHRARHSGMSSRASSFRVLSSGLTGICIAGPLIIPKPYELKIPFLWNNGPRSDIRQHATETRSPPSELRQEVSRVNHLTTVVRRWFPMQASYMRPKHRSVSRVILQSEDPLRRTNRRFQTLSTLRIRLGLNRLSPASARSVNQKTKNRGPYRSLGINRTVAEEAPALRPHPIPAEPAHGRYGGVSAPRTLTRTSGFAGDGTYMRVHHLIMRRKVFVTNPDSWRTYLQREQLQFLKNVSSGEDGGIEEYTAVPWGRYNPMTGTEAPPVQYAMMRPKFTLLDVAPPKGSRDGGRGYRVNGMVEGKTDGDSGYELRVRVCARSKAAGAQWESSSFIE